MTTKNRQSRRTTLFTKASAVAAGIALIAGCSGGNTADADDGNGNGNGNDGNGSSADRPNEGTVEMSWYGSDARNAAVQEVVDAFSAENSEVDVETQPTTFDNHWDRVSVQAAANNLPCVVAMQSRYQARYEDRGSLRPLDDLIEDGTIDVSGIPEVIMESQRNADGNVYTIPYGIWFEGATLNVPAIESHGASEPTDAGTWEDYVDWAGGVQADLPDGTWALQDRGDSITQFQAFAMSRGENLFGDGEVGFAEETLVEWFELWKGALDDGLVPSPEVVAEFQGVPPEQSLQGSARVLAASNGDNNISDIQIGLDHNDAGTISIVRSPSGDSPQVVGANGWAIAENCSNVVDSATFIDFFINSTEGAYTLETQTGLPPVTAILEEMVDDPEVNDAIKERTSLYFDLLEAGAGIDVWPDGTQQLVGQLATTYQEVAFDQKSAQQAASDFIGQANAGLAGF